jgi:hypothetical protein
LVNTKNAFINAKVEVNGVNSLESAREIWRGKKILYKNNFVSLKLEPLECAVLLW